MKNKKVIPIETNEITPEIKTSLRTRVITAIVMALVFIPCVLVGSWAYAILGFVLGGLAAYELVHVSKPSKRFRIPIYIMTITLVESYIFWIFIKNNIVYLWSENEFDSIWKIFNNNFNNIEVSIIALISTAAVYFLFSFLDDDTTIFKVVYYIAMSVIIGVCFQAFMYLRYSPFSAFSSDKELIESPLFIYLQSSFLLIYVVLGIICNDIGAYFVGILFGKNKVNPRISPKKTWEGVVGGIIFSVIVSINFAFVMSAINHPIFPVLDLSHWYWVILLSVCMPLIGDIGDFVFSAIKRYFGVKDYSNIFPGHGGVLDRLDSLLFGAALVSIFLVMITGGWTFGITNIPNNNIVQIVGSII